MTSDYASVTTQAGIYAGEGGFDVHVKDNTKLTGAVIASQARADKNALDTGSLTMEDIQNKAEYNAESKGITLSSENTNKRNPLGISTSMGIPVQGNAGSTTYSAIADGIIKVAGKETQEQINRDTEHALNQLGEIFNRKDVEERQALVGLVSKEGFTLIGDLAIHKRKELLLKAAQAKEEGKEALVQKYLKEADKWDDGGEYKVALHGAIGAVLSSMSGSSLTSGALGAGANEAMQKELKNIKNSELHKLASALIGGLAGNSSARTGAAIAMGGTAYNWLTHSDQMRLLRDYRDFIQLQHTIGMEAAKNEYSEKFAYYLALTDYEMGYSQLYGTSNQISKEFYDDVAEHDIAAMDHNFGIQFRELINNLVARYYTTPEELANISELRSTYYQSFVDRGRVWNDLAEGIRSGPYAPPQHITNMSDDELLATLPWGYQPDGRKYVILPDNSTMLTDRYMNEGDKLVASGKISYVNREGITVVDDGYGNSYYTMTNPILKNYGDKLANDGGEVVEGVDGNHYAIGPDGKYYYTVYPVNLHDMEWHLKNSIAEEVTISGTAKASEKLVQIAGKKSFSTTVEQVRRFSKTVGSKVGGTLQAGVLIENFAENHERYNNWEYKWKADAMDAGGAVISTGAGATVSSLYGPIAGIGAGIYVSGRVNSYIEEEKIKMDKQDKGETRKRGESK